MTYTPKPTPTKSQEIPVYVKQELYKISEALKAIEARLQSIETRLTNGGL